MCVCVCVCVFVCVCVYRKEGCLELGAPRGPGSVDLGVFGITSTYLV